MPLNAGNEIHTLIEKFKSREVFLYHACQLKDFNKHVNSKR